MKNKRLQIFPILCFFILFCAAILCHSGVNDTVIIGVILDSESWLGKVTKTAIRLAADDSNRNSHLLHGIPLDLQLRNAQTAFEAASAAVDLLALKNVAVIIGPQTSEAVELVSHFADAAEVPIVSFSAASASLSNPRFPDFVRIGHSDGSQMKAIAAVVNAYGWTKIIVIYPDDGFSGEAMLLLSDALSDVGCKIEYRSAISPAADNQAIRGELSKLKTMESRVFVAHTNMGSGLGLNLLMEAQYNGMMEAGYVWITTDGFTSLWDAVINKNASTMASMQGLLGVKTHIPNSNQLRDFARRWNHQFRLDNPDMDNYELNLYGVLAYDIVFIIAQAIRNIGNAASFSFSKPSYRLPAIGNAELKVFQQGKQLLQEILQSNFTGLSGHIQLRHGEMDGCTYEIVNVVGKSYHVVGYWTDKTSQLSATLPPDGDGSEKLGPVIWPGRSARIPRGVGKRLQIVVPDHSAWRQLIDVTYDRARNKAFVTGFCKDVFDAAVKKLNYEVLYDLVPYRVAYNKTVQSFYDELVKQVYLKRWDGVLGDVTITSKRTRYVDFTQPFTQSCYVMVVPTTRRQESSWAFLLPFTPEMWFTTGAFVIFTGIVVWLLEHEINPAFRGKPPTEVVTVISFALSTMFFAHREKIASNFSRLVIVVWLVVVFVLTSSYTASLSSRLTVEQLKPKFSSVEELIANNVRVGYQRGSYIAKDLIRMGIAKKNLKAYESLEEYAEALSKGPDKGGVAAIFDEMPYIRIFLRSRCGYTMVGPTYKTGGFGFAFHKGSSLVTDISRVILSLSESSALQKLEGKYIDIPTNCSKPGEEVSTRLGLGSFWGLYLITGTVSCLALIIFFYRLLNNVMENRESGPQEISEGKFIKLLSKYLDRKEFSSAVDRSKSSSTDNPFYESEGNHSKDTEHRQSGADSNISAQVSSVSICEITSDTSFNQIHE